MVDHFNPPGSTQRKRIARQYATITQVPNAQISIVSHRFNLNLGGLFFVFSESLLKSFTVRTRQHDAVTLPAARVQIWAGTGAKPPTLTAISRHPQQRTQDNLHSLEQLSRDIYIRYCILIRNAPLCCSQACPTGCKRSTGLSEHSFLANNSTLSLVLLNCSYTRDIGYCSCRTCKGFHVRGHQCPEDLQWEGVWDVRYISRRFLSDCEG